LIFNSEPFEQWEKKGKKDDLTLAKEKADWILKNHEPVMLDRGIIGRLDQIVKETAKATTP
jgi:trimethylamine:corrinoid methyltransferase-like protein